MVINNSLYIIFVILSLSTTFFVTEVHCTVYSLSTAVLKVGVTVTSSNTCLSSLQISLQLANDIVPNPADTWTPNLLTSTDGTCGDHPSGTTLATQTTASLIFPSGGNVIVSTSTNVVIQGITFPDNIATETWNITVIDSSLFWLITRQYESDGVMIADSFPAIWVYTTSGGYNAKDTNTSTSIDTDEKRLRRKSSSSLSDWRSTVQIPSYVSMDEALLNPETGYGYSVANGERVALLGDSTTGDTKRIMLSPSGIAMHMTIANGRFAMYRNPSIFTQTLGMGAETAVGPYGNGYNFYTGDTRETLFRLDFLPTNQGHGYFDFRLPSNASTVANFTVTQMNIMSQIFQLPMGWINGNSPQCETCVHEISVFPQLNGLFRVVAPPVEASSLPNPSPFNPLPSSNNCPALSNPFCGYNKQINTVTLSLECSGGSITDINAAYGTPTLSPVDDCSNFIRNSSCDDPNFLAYAAQTCMGQTTCILIRQPGDFDPCPNIEKAIVAVANCSGSSGGRVVPVPGQCPTVHDITGKFLTFLLSPLSGAVLPTGQMAPRWDIVSGIDWAWGGIIDQMPHMILAAYYHAVNTNDTAIVRTWLPTLQLVMDYMLDTMLVNSTYLLTNTIELADGVTNHSLADNWLDDVRFGWTDAIVNCYAVEAFRAFGDLLVWLNTTSSTGAYSSDAFSSKESKDDENSSPSTDSLSSRDANFYYTMHQNMVKAYNDWYWDESTSMYHDWIDKNNLKRNYFYVWHNFLAIEFGIANSTQSSLILNTADSLYAGIRTKYNVTAEQLWCTPTNLIPLDPSDLTVDFDDEYEYGHYENGDCFHWHYGLESLARSRVNGADTAFTRLTTAMQAFNVSRLWGQRYGWIDPSTRGPLGSDVITDGYFLIWGSLFGSLNIRPTLLNGIQTLGPAATDMNGSNYTFSYLGNDVTIQVTDGYARVVEM